MMVLRWLEQRRKSLQPIGYVSVENIMIWLINNKHETNLRIATPTSICRKN